MQNKGHFGVLPIFFSTISVSESAFILCITKDQSTSKPLREQLHYVGLSYAGTKTNCSEYLQNVVKINPDSWHALHSSKDWKQ